LTAAPLHLVPAGLGEAPWDIWLPPATRDAALGLRHWVVENAKTARAQLKALGHPGPMADVSITELPREPKQDDLDRLLAPALTGTPLGLMSEAGCPAIADPGALLVRRAHELGVPVKPHVGPSSLLLALMASGLDGQRFAFHGYLPVKEPELLESLRRLEKESARLHQTQVFIETPYRNLRSFAAVLTACRDSTRLALACGLTTPEEWIVSRTVRDWKRAAPPPIEKVPTVFCLLA
jgi:16S rRNA (cytidine1402-2'-O)-methyltransferase